MLKRQWTVPVLALAFVVGGLLVAAGCSKTSNPVSSVSSNNAIQVSPNGSTHPTGSEGHSFSIANNAGPKIPSSPVTGPNCGFDPANYVEDDLTELVATAIKKNTTTTIAGTTVGRQNHYRSSNYLGDVYGANAPDITYQFTLTQDELPNQLYFYTCGPSPYGTASFNHILKLFTGNCSNYESQASYNSCGTGTYVGYWFTQPGTYFVVLDGYYYAYDQGKFVLTICPNGC